MSEELLDIFNDNYQKLGQASHAVVHRTGEWHRTIHCWLIEKASGRILYQRRSASKRLYPNKLDVSVAGHCRAGEAPLEALEREGREELGMAVEPESVTPIGIRRNAFAGTAIVDREFQHVFFAHLPCAIEDIEFRDREVSAVLLLKPEEVIAIHERGFRTTTEAWDGHCRSTVNIGKNDFISSIDDYDLKIPIQVRRWLAGEEYIRI